MLTIFIEYLGKVMGDIAVTLLPFGGIYLTSTVILEIEFLLSREDIKKMFLEKFQEKAFLAD